MGRHRDRSKVEQEREEYLQAHRKVRKELRKELGGPITIKAKTFDALAKPLRTAARKANLKLLKGAILRKNNRAVCRVLFFPEEIEIVPCDDPEKNGYVFCKTIVIQAEYDKGNGTYTVEELERIDNQMWASEFYQICLQVPDESGIFNLSEREFTELIYQYVDAFRAIELAEIPYFIRNLYPDFYPDTQWERERSKKIWKFYNFTSRELCKKLFYIDFDSEREKIGRVRTYRLPDHPIESFLFAATLFSLCKRLFCLCGLSGIDYNFALQIVVGDGSFPIDKHHTVSFQGEKYIEEKDMNCLCYSIWTINEYLRLYCDYRIAKYSKDITKITADERKEHKEKENGKFRNNWAVKEPPALWEHLGFPLLYSDYHKAGWYGEIKRYQRCPPQLTKASLEELSEAWCLPIILPAVAPKKDYPAKNCLTITWPLLGTEDVGKVEKRFNSQGNGLFYEHEYIKAVYYQFMNVLEGKDRKALRKTLKRAYTAALKTVSMRPDTPTKDEEHKACLLGALYFAQDTYRDAGILQGYKELLFECNIENTISVLRRVATAKEFAEFVREAQEDKDPIIFYRDNDGIYLHYKGYWDRFMNYCEKQNVSLPYSAGMFRREVLAPKGYIRPQYRSQRAKAQIRYDYRKKNPAGEKAVVLNVSPDLLQLAYPKAQNEADDTDLLHQSPGENEPESI